MGSGNPSDGYKKSIGREFGYSQTCRWINTPSLLHRSSPGSLNLMIKEVFHIYSDGIYLLHTLLKFLLTPPRMVSVWCTLDPPPVVSFSFPVSAALIMRFGWPLFRRTFTTCSSRLVLSPTVIVNITNIPQCV